MATSDPVLSIQERNEIKAHMGYPLPRAVAGFALGVPAAIETSFLIERALDQVTIEGAFVVRECLCALNQIECQMLGDLDLMAANQVGNITLNQNEQSQLDVRFLRWLSKLETVLGCERNPYDRRWASMVNLRVRG